MGVHESLGDWSDIRKRLNEEFDRKAGSARRCIARRLLKLTMRRTPRPWRCSRISPYRLQGADTDFPVA